MSEASKDFKLLLFFVNRPMNQGNLGKSGKSKSNTTIRSNDEINAIHIELTFNIRGPTTFFNELFRTNFNKNLLRMCKHSNADNDENIENVERMMS